MIHNALVAVSVQVVKFGLMISTALLGDLDCLGCTSVPFHCFVNFSSLVEVLGFGPFMGPRIETIGHL